MNRLADCELLISLTWDLPVIVFLPKLRVRGCPGTFELSRAFWFEQLTVLA